MYVPIHTGSRCPNDDASLDVADGLRPRPHGRRPSPALGSAALLDLRRLRALRFCLLVVAAVLSAGHAESGYALDGNTYVIICPCVASADYINAATLRAQEFNQGGTYNFTVVSSSGPATALIQTKANLIRLGNGRVVADVYSAIPVNSSGASLAGDTEPELQTYFTSYDMILMGTSRSNPLIVQEPPNYQTSFIGSIDEEVGPGIDQALAAIGVSWLSLPIGYVITVQFADGTTALYIKNEQEYTDHWVWTGIAWNKKGQRIGRGGALIPNPSTSGTGGGQANAPGFGEGAGRYNWTLIGGNDCTQTLTVTDGDGNVIESSTIFVSCD